MKRVLAAVFIILVAVTLIHAERIKVERVVDGDTFVDSEGNKYRLVGIDAPESKHPTKPVDPNGVRAAEFLTYLIEGKQVEVTYDSKSAKKDRYGRQLVIVWDGDSMINGMMLIGGLATVETRFPVSTELRTNLEQYQAIAQAEYRGIWSNTRPQVKGNDDICEMLYGARVIADDGTYLGKLLKASHPESIFNEYGLYGSEYALNSIWNSYSMYGGEYSLYSPFNEYSQTPPAIVVGNEIIGYISINTYLANAVHPDALKAGCNWY